MSCKQILPNQVSFFGYVNLCKFILEQGKTISFSKLLCLQQSGSIEKLCLEYFREIADPLVVMMHQYDFKLPE